MHEQDYPVFFEYSNSEEKSILVHYEFAVQNSNRFKYFLRPLIPSYYLHRDSQRTKEIHGEGFL